MYVCVCVTMAAMNEEEAAAAAEAVEGRIRRCVICCVLACVELSDGCDE